MIRITLHGTMCCIAGVGVLITGQPGTGKSRLAFSLLEKRQQLISDDATDIYLDSSTLIARCPPAIQNKLWLNGLGLIDVQKYWGKQSIKQEQSLDLVVALCGNDSKKKPRLLHNTITILGITIPKIHLSKRVTL